MKSIALFLFALSFTGVSWGQKMTIAEENLEKTRAALIGKWEVLRSGSQAEAKKIGITGDYIEFTDVEVYPQPVHNSLKAHYKIKGNWHGFSSFSFNKDKFPMIKGDASYDPTTSTWSFGFQLELPLELPGGKLDTKRLVSKSGLLRGTELLISNYGIDSQGDPHSTFEVGVKLPDAPKE